MNWQLLARCSETPHNQLDWFSDDASTRAACKAVCATCPVKIACLRNALAEEEPGARNGVLGGTTPEERADMEGDYT